MSGLLIKNEIQLRNTNHSKKLKQNNITITEYLHEVYEQ
jgi:hypothetical protein